MAGFTVYNDKIDLDELFGIDFDEVAEEALKEAAPILERSMKAAVQALSLIHISEPTRPY